MSNNIDFTNEQLERIDEVQNAAFDFCKVLTEKEDLEWDMSFIGEICDSVCYILNSHGLQTRYPERIENEDGTVYINDYTEFP